MDSGSESEGYRLSIDSPIHDLSWAWQSSGWHRLPPEPLPDAFYEDVAAIRTIFGDLGGLPAPTTYELAWSRNRRLNPPDVIDPDECLRRLSETGARLGELATQMTETKEAIAGLVRRARQLDIGWRAITAATGIPARTTRRWSDRLRHPLQNAPSPSLAASDERRLDT